MNDMEIRISVAVLISIIGLFCTVYSTYVNGKRSREDKYNDRLKADEQFIKINFKLDQFCADTRRLVDGHDKMSDELKDINKTLVKHDEQLNDHEKRIEKIERR